MDNILLSCLIFIVSFLLYFNSVFCTFVFDDISAIVKNKDVLGKTPLSNLLWNDYWGTPMLEERSHKSYRPFTVLTFRMNHFLISVEPWSFHLINVLLYSVVCVLTFHFYRKIVRLSLCVQKISILKENLKIKVVESEENSFEFITTTATFLFIVHSVHVEAVTSIVGRAELLSAVFVILSMLFYLRSSKLSFIMSLLSCIFAVASKEQGITALAICAFLDIAFVNKLCVDEFCLVLVTSLISPRRCKFKRLFLRLFILASVAFVLLCFRYELMHGTVPYFTVFDNPSAAASFPARHLTLNYLLPVNAWLLLSPNNLLCDWTMGTISLVKNMYDVRNIFTFLFWIVYAALGLSIFLRGFHSKICSIAVVIATATFLPASNLFFNVGFVVAERILFLPSIGFCLLSATGMWILKSKYKFDHVVWALLCITLVSHSLKTFHRNFEWKNEMELFKSGLKVSCNNAKLWNNVGHAYEAIGQHKEALNYFVQAADIEVTDIGAHMNIARMYEELGDKNSAEMSYWKAKSLLPKPVRGKTYTARIPPSSLQLFAKLANLMKEQDRLGEALRLYNEAIAMRPDFVDAYINRGELLMKMNMPKDALESYRNALKLKPENISDVYFNVGVVSAHLGNTSAAVEAYTFAIVNNPNHIKALFNSAVIFRETGDRSLLQRARTRVERILYLEPNNVFALTLAGAICMDLDQYSSAIKWWKEALKIEPAQKTCLFNLAYVYSKMDGRTADCIRVIEGLLQVYPNHTKGLLLYGDVMLKQMKNVTQAQSAYSRLIEVEPTNIEGQHNYCVTLVELQQLKQAESCLLRVYAMAPHEDYIQDNLALVRRQINAKEIREQTIKKKKETNFKIPESLVVDNTQEESHKSIEDIIFVGQLDGKQLKKVKEEEENNTVEEENGIEEAQRISDSLKIMKDNDIEANLKKAASAVARLKEIQLKVKERTKRCAGSSLKENALKFLDKLEEQL